MTDLTSIKTIETLNFKVRMRDKVIQAKDEEIKTLNARIKELMKTDEINEYKL